MKTHIISKLLLLYQILYIVHSNKEPLLDLTNLTTLFEIRNKKNLILDVLLNIGSVLEIFLLRYLSVYSKLLI